MVDVAEMVITEKQLMYPAVNLNVTAWKWKKEESVFKEKLSNKYSTSSGPCQEISFNANCYILSISSIILTPDNTSSTMFQQFPKLKKVKVFFP